MTFLILLMNIHIEIRKQEARPLNFFADPILFLKGSISDPISVHAEMKINSVLKLSSVGEGGSCGSCAKKI